MKKQLTLFLMVLLCLAVTYGVQRWTMFSPMEFKDFVHSEKLLIKKTSFGCNPPLDSGMKDIKSDEVTLYWDDDFGTRWEYIVQLPSDPYPIDPGIPVNAKEVTVTQDNKGNNLQPNTEYEFYVRTNCGANGMSSWLGPIHFRTLCVSYTPFFQEDFSTTSSTFNCWTIVDANGDSTSPTDDNIWRLYTRASLAYSGDSFMYFRGRSEKKHDDWLISPTFQLDSTKNYQLTYYLQGESIDFDVLLSTDGTDINSFTTILQSNKESLIKPYQRKTIYIQKIEGEVNVAWRIFTDNQGFTILMDLITLEEVDCIAPLEEEIIVSNVRENSATIAWEDDVNTSWEYYVQNVGSGTPSGGGRLRTDTSVVITTDQSGAILLPYTEYEVFVRSSCKTGKFSEWIGPIAFKTLCAVAPFPFWEGFNSNSETLDCWTIIDGNQDSKSKTSDIWHMSTTLRYEGTHSARFYGTSAKALPHDDWLISPTFTLDSTKIYRLKYYYRTTYTAVYDYEFGVYLSNNGIDTREFTTEIIPKQKYGPSTWVECKAFITGIRDDVHLAWHVTSETPYTDIYIDDIHFEEVSCAEPLNLGSKDEKENSVVVFWTDNIGTDWQYVVQRSRGNVPLSGTTTKSKEVVVTSDKNGDILEANTEYELYVRTNCGGGKEGEWSGPYKFRTACPVFAIPFWEGFNDNSNTIYCWTILDGNGDGTTSAGMWSQYKYNHYEGTHSMYFYDNTVDTDDWLISPVFTFDPGKIYRLKYHYRTNSNNESNNFEVLASNRGINPADFTKEIVKDKAYKNENYLEEKAFISGLSGSVNIAWHVKGTGSKTLYIDNVFVEEVTGCPEPLNLDVTDIDKREATLSWTDDFGVSKWEYTVQKAGEGIPTGMGTVTTQKENVVTTDASGSLLEPNTDYEYYVRTYCGNGEYSIWTGPFVFVTPCDVYTAPFWEGFNSDLQTVRCWEIIDADNNGIMWQSLYSTVYEGDGVMSFSSSGYPNDDWLISPTITLDGGMYVLKYHYQTLSSESKFEILASVTGTDTADFTTVIKPVQTYYKNDKLFKEEVVFFSGITGDVNIAWHLTTSGNTFLYLDNVFLKKVETCPEPYYVKVIGQTTTSIDLEWQQEDDVTSWEVLVVDYKEDETHTPIKNITVTGTHQTTITGLDEGKAYTIYVRAKCIDGKNYSDWSTPVNTGTQVGVNDDCAGAINIPVNKTTACEKTVSVSTSGATMSSIANVCNTWDFQFDVWFEFIATSTAHLLKVLDVAHLENTSRPNIELALFNQNCATMASPIGASLECFSLSEYKGYQAMLTGLIPGQKYYLRIGGSSPTQLLFNLCLTSYDGGYLEVSPSGEKYSVEELINDVLINSNCDLVSNVRYQAGDGTNGMNTLAYFNRGDSDFPFEEGIVLATHGSEYIEGPYRGFEVFKPRIPFWTGDPDLNRVINQVGGVGFGSEKAVAVLEFDFIPVKDSIKFEYLFVSDSFNGDCAVVCKPGGALFAAWLTEIETGEGQNLALVPGTTDPIAISTIRDNQKSGADCDSTNPEYYWRNYDNNQDTPLTAPVNYTGMTVPMSSETVAVKPGKKYHIKLAIADFCRVLADASAVFFNAGSFDLGSLDLGQNLLVATNNALCEDESVVIQSGVVLSDELDTEIEWYKDGVLLENEKQPDLEIIESGEYSIKVKFPNLECEFSDFIVVEIYPPISEIVHQAKDIIVCRQALEEVSVNLISVETEMFKDVERSDYTTEYYTTIEEAEASENAISNTENYVLGKEPQAQTLYIRVESIITGCHEIFELHIQPEQGAIPNKPSDVTVCAEYVFPEVNGEQYYYMQPGGEGKAYKTGDVLAEPGEHTIYLLQVNSDDGCYEETAYQVNITAPVVADVFEDKTLSCEYYELKPLSEYNHYFTEPGGKGNKLYPGMQILEKEIVYVYASSEDYLCTDESSFTIDYEDCPIPRGISPNGDNLNDVFDLTPHGVESIKIYNRWGTEVYSYGAGYTTQWHGQNKNGKQLPDGTYYYVIIAHGKTRTGWVQINK